jgi:hypothetical protein
VVRTRSALLWLGRSAKILIRRDQTVVQHRISQLFEIPIVAFPMSWPNTRRSLPTRFGIVAPATSDLIIYCETAEALDFEAAWLFRSHMVYSDVYVIMALYALRTRRMTFGTGIAVAPPRRLRTTSGSELG